MAGSVDMADADVQLLGFLDMYRGIAEHKVSGFSPSEATAVTTPTGVTALGIVRHLAWDERGWFGHFFLGEPSDGIESDESFHIGPTGTVTSVVEAYRTECARSRDIVASAASMDEPGAIPHDYFGAVDLRWIVVHMLEETARHVGHLDILTELTDGRTGN